MLTLFVSPVFNPDALFDLSDKDLLSSYLDSFNVMQTTTTATTTTATTATNSINIIATSTITDDGTSLSAGAIAGIVISAIVVIISATVMILIVGVYWYRRCRHRKQIRLL